MADHNVGVSTVGQHEVKKSIPITSTNDTAKQHLFALCDLLWLKSFSKNLKRLGAGFGKRESAGEFGELPEFPNLGTGV